MQELHHASANGLDAQCILRMHVSVPRCPSRPFPVSRLFHAGVYALRFDMYCDNEMNMMVQDGN